MQEAEGHAGRTWQLEQRSAAEGDVLTSVRAELDVALADCCTQQQQMGELKSKVCGVGTIMDVHAYSTRAYMRTRVLLAVCLGGARCAMLESVSVSTQLVSFMRTV